MWLGSSSWLPIRREASIGRKRDGDEAGQRHREGEDEAELGEKPAGDAGEERDRNEDRHKRRGGREDGEEHLLQADNRGGARPEPKARWREIFSMTTMASSTTRPVASTRASSVMMLIEKPTSHMAASVPISAIGTVMAGMKVTRAERRNR